MPIVEWEEKYLLGVEQFDAHHKHLVGLLNKVYEMFLLNDVAEGKLQEILDSLAEYANYHFDQEEFNQVRWFSSTDVPYERSDPHMRRCIEKLKNFNQL